MSKRPRKSTRGASSSSQPFDATKFVSFQASERYRKMVVTKSFVPQRGFSQSDPGHQVHEQVRGRGWEEFIKRPIPAVLPVVREFYANAKEHENKTVFVRGKRVSFDRQIINQYYRLQEVDDIAFREYSAHPDHTDLIAALTENTVPWRLTATGDDVLHFATSGLEYTFKAWHYFISANILPTRHVSEVTKERAVLNYALHAGYAIDIGRLIEKSILESLAEKTTAGLGHPALIYGLCLAMHVPASADEEVLHPKADMTREMIWKYKRTGGEAPESSHRRQQPTPRRRTKTSAQRQVTGPDRTDIRDILERIGAQQARTNKQVARLIKRQLAMETYLQQSVHQITASLQALAGTSSTDVPAAPSMPPLSPDAEAAEEEEDDSDPEEH